MNQTGLSGMAQFFQFRFERLPIETVAVTLAAFFLLQRSGKFRSAAFRDET